jgi:hypothetical protein
MSAWSSDELDRLGRAEELQIASRRADGSLRPYVTIWTVRADDGIYVRSAYGPNNGWFVRANASGRGRIRAGGIERDVTFERPTDRETAAEVSREYRAKYDRYGASIVASVTSSQAEELTLRIAPEGDEA